MLNYKCLKALYFLWLYLLIYFARSLYLFMQNKEQLWTTSPCTIGFAGRKTVIERTERFKLFSIYAKDDVNKKKKVFSDLQKPELLVTQFRRQIEEANREDRRRRRQKMRLRSQSIQRKSTLEEISHRKPSQTMLITNRLYQNTPQLEMKHDFFGNRSSYVMQPQQHSWVNQLSQFSLPLKKVEEPFRHPFFFTRARRMDLSKPRNFFPGPGSYYPFNESNPQLQKYSKSKSNTLQTF